MQETVAPTTPKSPKSCNNHISYFSPLLSSSPPLSHLLHFNPSLSFLFFDLFVIPSPNPTCSEFLFRTSLFPRLFTILALKPRASFKRCVFATFTAICQWWRISPIRFGCPTLSGAVILGFANTDNFPICAGLIFFVSLEPQRCDWSLRTAHRREVYELTALWWKELGNRNHIDLRSMLTVDNFFRVGTLTGIVNLSPPSPTSNHAFRN
jgi:hypothetical protein